MGLFDVLKKKAAAAVNNGTAATGIRSALQNAGNKSVDVVFAEVPSTYEGFTALPQAAMSTPFDTAAMTVVALCAWPLDAELSIRMLNYLRGPRPLSNMDISFIRDRFYDKDYVPRSYFNGSVPGNDYTPQEPYTITVSDNPYSYQNESYATLYIRSGGADNPRQVQLRQAKDGKWYLWDQFLLPDIRKPESENPWA
ncbi:MAG: hypothetical protein IJ412_02945 [Oscillospiraceae bacterium]|nr:hypothetical protein [Oscillospiraceae bacterium]